MGNVLYKIDRRSFNSKDMEDMLREIRDIAGPKKKLAIVWDRARFHTTRSVFAVASDPAVDIKLILNVTARPDMATCGIETVWSLCKKRYRAIVERCQCLNR